MKRMKKWLEKRWVAYTVAACIAVVLFVLLNHLPPIVSGIGTFLKILSPVFIGIALAYLIDPIALFFERTVFKKTENDTKRRIFSAVLAFICFLAGIVVFLIILVPALINSVKDFIGNSSYYYNRIQWLIDYINNLEIGIKLNIDSLLDSLKSIVTNTFIRITTDFSSFLSSIGSLGSYLLNWIVGIIMAAYFLLGKKGLLRGINRLRSAIWDDEKLERNNIFLRRTHEIFISYIGCDLLDGLIVGVANAVFMTTAGINNVALVSLIVGVTNLLPTFGPLIGGAIGALIILLSSAKHALWFIIFTIVLQTIDGYILKPRLFGSSLGIPAVWTLIAIIIGGKLFGVLGVFLSIPVAAVVAIIYREQLVPRLEERKRRRKEQKLADSIQTEDITESDIEVEEDASNRN